MSSTELNLWSSFLRESSKRTQSLESTCIIVGDEHCGKRQLSSVLCGVDNSKDSNASYSSVVSYNYFDIDDKDMETTARVNTWLFEKNIFDSSHAVLKNACKTDKLIFMLVLDLSKPETCVTSLQKWLVKINSFTSKYYSELSSDNAKASKQAFVDYLKNVRKTKGSVVAAVAPEDNETEAEEEVEHFEANFISEHFGLPIVVVGAKADTLVSDSSAAMKQARELQGRIRSLCLEVGAGLIFTSSVGPSTVNCAELKKYVVHRLYPAQIGMDLSLQDKLEACFIPAGFDTMDLIKISTAAKHNAEEVQNKLKSDIAASKATKAAKSASEADASNNNSATATGEFKVELEGEQVWLTGLHEFIQQVSASGAPSAAPSATHSRVPSDASAVSTAAAANTAGSATGASAGTAGKSVSIAAAEGVAGDAAAAGIADDSATTGRITRGAAAGGRSKSIAGGRSVVPAADKKEVGDFFKNLLKK